jgi:Skp family chaperone for outer membrane proteins
MNKMIKTLAMVAVMFAAVTTTAKAQDAAQQQGRRGGGRGGMNPAMVLKDSLHVSDAVAAKADSIYKAYQAESAPLMEAMRGGDADARTKMTAARTKMTDAIKALLTDEQKAAYDKLVPQGGGRRGGGSR